MRSIQLQKQVLLVILPTLLLAVVVLIFFNRGVLLNMQLNQIAAAFGTVHHQARVNAEAQVEFASANMEMLSRLDVIYKYLSADETTDQRSQIEPALMRSLINFRRSMPRYSSIQILDADANSLFMFEDALLAKSGGPNVPLPILTKLIDSDGETVFEWVDDETGTESVMKVGRPLYKDPWGEFALGVRSDNEHAALVGYLLFTMDKSPLALLQERVYNVSKNRLLFTTNSGCDVFRVNCSIDERMPDSVMPSGVEPEYFRDVAIDGVPSMVAAGRVGPNLLMFTLIPESRLRFAQLKLIALLGLPSLLIIGFVGIVVNVAIRRLVILPILALRTGANAIQAGSTEPITVDESSPEISDLSTALNSMRASLQISSERLKKIAETDELTGLPNRRTLTRSMELALEAAGKDYSAALMFLDLDNFKEVNDALGHLTGDELLKKVSQRFLDAAAACADASTVLQLGRWGGDEFILFCDNLKSREHAGSIANRILESCSAPFWIAGEELRIGASIGIAMLESNLWDVHGSLRHADIAMYEAKKLPGNSYRFFDHENVDQLQRRMAIANRLVPAFNADLIRPYYQPIVSLQDGKTVQLEALLRWTDSELGYISPVEFIALAEERGFIIDLTQNLIQCVCSDIRYWNSMGCADVSVNINLSMSSAEDWDLSYDIARLVKLGEVPSSRIVLEITESAMAVDSDELHQQLTDLRKKGFRVVMDDFGTGYSSLSQLHKLPLDGIKLDKIFIDQIQPNSDTPLLLTNIIGIAKAMNLTLTAEGVETEYQRDELARMGCETAQGWLFEKAISPQAVVKYLKEMQSERMSA